MPKFQVTAPNGKKFIVNAPPGGTQEEALARVQAAYKPKPSPTSPQIDPETVIPSVSPHATIDPGQVIPGATAAPARPYVPTMEENLANIMVGVSDSPAGKAVSDMVINPAGRGLVNLQQQANVIGQQAGIYSPQQGAEHIVANEAQKRNQFPTAPYIAEGTKNIYDAFNQGIVPGIKSLAENPSAILNVGVESLTNSLPAMAGGAVGALAGTLAGPAAPIAVLAGRAAGTGLGSAFVDYPATVISELQSAGVDLNDANAVQAALSNPDMMAKINDSARKHASVVALFDALSGGIGGRGGAAVERAVTGAALKNSVKAGEAVTSQATRKAVSEAGTRAAIAGGATELGMQSTLGAAGEAGGQVAQSGKITSPADVAMEAVGEIGPGAVESATGAASTKMAQKSYNEAIAKGRNNQIPQAPQPPSQGTPPATVDQATPTPAKVPLGATPESQASVPAAPVAQKTADGTEQAQPEESKPTQPQPASAPPPTKKVVTPDGSMEIETQDQVVDINSLRHAQGDNQPRNRDKATSDLQIQKISNELDPERLGQSRTSDIGSPIIGPDNQIDSGNGRIAAIRQAYEKKTPRAEAYKQHLKEQGHNIDGIENPVLVRRRLTEFTPEQRVRFNTLSSKAATAEFSSTEKARADAKQIDDGMLDLHKGGSPDSVENQDFMRAFVGKVATPNETGALVGTDGLPTQEGVKRANAAMVAKAYDDSDLVENIFDSSDPEVKSIGNVLRDRAPEFAHLRANVKRGDTPAAFDITKQIMEAVKIVRNSRRDKQNIRDAIEGTNQTSLLEGDERDPIVEKIVRSMYRPGLGRMLSQSAIDKVLGQYATEAREQRDHDLFGKNKTTPSEILDRAYQKVASELETKTDGPQLALADAAEPRPTPAAENKSSRVGQPGKMEANAEELAKTGGKKFDDFSKNDNININKQVFVDIGLDPDKSVQLPPVEQRALVAKAIKDKFGLEISADKKLNIKDQLDQLMDMYVGLNNMAFALGLPTNSMSLGGAIKLRVAGKRPFLGQFDPATGEITIPEKSNSWAHEWAHALDKHLTEKFGPIGDYMLSKAVRKEGVPDVNNPVQNAFANVLNALFFDKSLLAGKIMDLEHKAQNGRTEKVRQEALEQLDKIAAGNYAGINIKNNFYHGARKMPGDSSYWTKPEEMLARAVEAYMGYRFDQLGVTSRAISKGNLAYDSNADERLAKTFPKLEDRMHIFSKLDDFFSVLGEAEILGKDYGDAVLQNDPNYFGVFDPRYWSKTIPETNNNWLKRQVEQIKADAKTAKIRRENRKEEAMANGQDVSLKGMIKESAKKSLDQVRAFWDYTWRTERTEAHAIEKKYSSDSAKELLDRLFTRPGQSTAVNEVYDEKITTGINKGSKVLESIIKENGLQNMSNLDKQQLRNAFLGMDVSMPANSQFTSEQIHSTAAKLRAFSDEFWKRMRKAGFDIGYVEKGAWLRRHYLKEKITENPEAFLEKANLVYLDQFDEVFGSPEKAIENISEFHEMIKGMLKADPNGVSFNKKKIDELSKSIDENNTEGLQGLVSNIYNDVRAQYAELAANAWLTNLINDFSRSEFESSFPKPGFMNGRALPASADKHLKDFMDTDVERILFHYMVSANTAIAQKDVINPKGKPSMAKLFEKMRAEGVSADDAQDLEVIINRTMFGPDVGPRAKKIGAFISVMRMASILMNLNKVVMTAVTEPLVIGLKTRNVMNGIISYKDSISDMIGTQDANHFKEVSKLLGAIGTDYADMMQSERFGGGFESGLLTRETMAKFFRYTGNTGITNMQSRIAIRAGYRWMSFLSDRLLNGTTAQKGMAARDLAELGISKNESEGFAKWLLNNEGRPNLAEINNDSSSVYGAKFMTAAVRFRDQAIQHPKKQDRPALANHPVGSVLYTGMGFTFSFWDNVVKAETKKMQDILKNEGGAEFAKVFAHHVATIGLSVALGALINMARMAIFDHDKWKELSKDDPEELKNLVLGRSIENTNLLGPAYSVIWNAYRGTDYGRDVATSLSGMVLSNYFNWLQKGFELFGEKNSKNNLNAEREFAKQTVRVMVAPAITAAMLNAPGPAKLMALPIGIATMFVNSNTTADKVADVLVAPKEKKGGKKKSELTEPREPKEPKD